MRPTARRERSQRWLSRTRPPERKPADVARAPARLRSVSWALTILGIVVLIVLHELGHFTAAKAVGMRVERFSLFFPPTIARIRRGETEYAIGALPFGGYVKITGMSPEELKGSAPAAAAEAVLPGAAHTPPDDGTPEFELDPEITRRAYCNQAPWKRIVVILAGPGVNIAIAFLLFWAVLFAGSINGAIALGNLDPSVNTLATTTSVLAVDKQTPAEGTLRPGDHILAVDGKSPVTVSSARAAIESHRCAGTATKDCRAATPVHLTVRRSGRDVALSVYPRYEQEAKRMEIGFAFGEPKRFGALAAAGASVSEMWHVTEQTLTGFAPRADELQGARGNLEHRRHHRGRARNGRRRRGLCARVPRLHLADPRRDQPLPVPAAGRRAHPVGARREGARKAHLARGDVPLQLGRHRADAVPRVQRLQQRHRTPRWLTSRARTARRASRSS